MSPVDDSRVSDPAIVAAIAQVIHDAVTACNTIPATVPILSLSNSTINSQPDISTVAINNYEVLPTSPVTEQVIATTLIVDNPESLSPDVTVVRELREEISQDIYEIDEQCKLTSVISNSTEQILDPVPETIPTIVTEPLTVSENIRVIPNDTVSRTTSKLNLLLQNLLLDTFF